MMGDVPDQQPAALDQPLSLRATRSVLHRLAGAPPRVLSVLGGRRRVVDGQELLPEARLAVRFLNAAPGESIERLPLAQARAELAAESWVFAARTHIAQVTELTVPGGQGPLPARRYDPAPERDPLGILVWFHGGGYVLGDLDTNDDLCRFLARASGLVVVSVGYRLAPEHRYPAAVEDAVAATRAHLGGAPVLVGGDFSGGGLAALVAQQVDGLAGQVLAEPWLDLVEESASYDLFGSGYTLTRDLLRWHRGLYLTDAADAVPASAARTADLRGLPPTVLVGVGFDPLRDEGLAYADRLEAVGVDVARVLEPGLPHAAIPATGVSRRSREMIEQTGTLLRTLVTHGTFTTP